MEHIHLPSTTISEALETADIRSNNTLWVMPSVFDRTVFDMP